MHNVDILLATYNGERYLDELMESLLAQSYSAFRIVVRDDGSSDATRIMLEGYKRSYPDKIHIIDDDAPTGSARDNFSNLTRASNANYIMYCDQDDYWYPDKIAQTMELMLSTEANCKDTPILIHGDLKVVDAQRRIIAPSFWRYQGLNAALTDVSRLLVQNNITGCTVMINSRLREIALPFPRAMIMHDWWLGLVASITGVIARVEIPLIDYRQHSANDTGAKQYNFRYIANRIVAQIGQERFRESKRMIEATQRQAEALLERYSSLMTERQRKSVADYVSLAEHGALARRYIVIANRLLKQGIGRNLAYLASL